MPDEDQCYGFKLPPMAGAPGLSVERARDEPALVPHLDVRYREDPGGDRRQRDPGRSGDLLGDLEITVCRLKAKSSGDEPS